MKALITTVALLCILQNLNAEEIGLRIRFGLTDRGNTKWDGTVKVNPGRVASIDGWRFQQTDGAIGTTGWKATTRPLTVRRSNNKKKAGKGVNKGRSSLMADNGVILVLEDVTADSVVEVATAQGNFRFKLGEIAYGKVVEKLKGAVEVERVAASRPLTRLRTDDDYPAAATAEDGTVYVAYLSFTPGLDRDERARSYTEEPKEYDFLATPAGGDRLWLRMQKNGRWLDPVAVTPGQGDLYKCALTVDGDGRVWAVWSERRDGNFDIFTRSWKDNIWSKTENLSTHAGNDVNPAAATDAHGRVWITWQGARDNVFRILAKRRTEAGKWSDELRVSNQSRTCWIPAIAATEKNGGRVTIAWDTYEKGDYDVWFREYATDGTASAPRPAANGALYEARPSLTYDKEGRLWVSYEKSGPTWGKDWGAYERETGTGLYRDRQIGLRIWDGKDWHEPAQPLAGALPGAKPRKGARNLPVRRPEPEATSRKKGEEAEPAPANAYNNLARIACDRDGRIWIFARSREGTFHTPLGSVWMDHAAYYDGTEWVGPIILPHSDNLLYNLPAVAAHPDGGLIVAHSSDHRQDRHVRRGNGGNASLDADKDPFDNDIYVSRLAFDGAAVQNRLQPARYQPRSKVTPTKDTNQELGDVTRIRGFRARVNDRELRILRGEFHRHTEISGDGGNDGPLEDMWRYAIDAALFDWIGNGDHDNGGGREYTWWLTQKTTDAYHLPGSFDPLFSYERSVRYPEGHRNVVFAYRGVRTLPRLPISARDFKGHAPDTQMLYKYLRHFDGVCASHTSATAMGTDWRDWDPVVEPMVEIYQGARQNYERPGAPRSPTADDAIGGWEPLGFVNLALKKGHRFSFQSSSDHGSTHISYCLVYAEDNTREAIHRAMKQRHTYGATDNIIADYRCTAGGREYMMGDEFSLDGPPTLRLKLVGTAPFAKVTLIKDDVELKVWEPGKKEFEVTWTDPAPSVGKASYYYFRGEQVTTGTEKNGELVWVSPMWITAKSK